MSARDSGKGGNWVGPAWMQRALLALKDSFDVHLDMKRDMVEFLLDEGFWIVSKKSTTDESRWSSAINRFNANLNPDRDEFFKFTELWALMKRFDRHALFLAMAKDLGYEVRRVPTDERLQALLERVADQLRIGNDQQAYLLHQVEQLGGADVLRRIHPAIAAGTASFSFGEPGTDGEDEPGRERGV